MYLITSRSKVNTRKSTIREGTEFLSSHENASPLKGSISSTPSLVSWDTLLTETLPHKTLLVEQVLKSKGRVTN